MRFMVQTASSRLTFHLQLTLVEVPLNAVDSHLSSCQNAVRLLVQMLFISVETLSWQIYQKVPLSILHLISFTDAVEVNS